jgi:hypothetical protein
VAILDAGPFQTWISAFDRHERAQRRYEAAGRLNNRELIDYLRGDLDQAAAELNAAIRAMNAH